MILWDVSGVLFKSDTLRLSFFEVGWRAFAAYFVFERKNVDHLKHLLFEDLLFRLSENNPTFDSGACMPDGSKMSPMMMAWLKGTISGYELIELLKQLIQKLDEENYFKSKRERSLIVKLIEVVFNPSIISAYTKPIKSGLSLLKESNMRGNRNGIVSNWDSLSFDHLNNTEHGRSVFSLIQPEDIFISGKYGLIKPDKEFFGMILEKCMVEPSECFFIDDQPENIAAAKACGIKGHCLGDGDYDLLRQSLIKEGYL